MYLDANECKQFDLQSDDDKYVYSQIRANSMI